jgi:hypothetical protein
MREIPLLVLLQCCDDSTRDYCGKPAVVYILQLLRVLICARSYREELPTVWERNIVIGCNVANSCQWKLLLGYKMVVVLVTTDPVPNDCITNLAPKSTVAIPNTNRVNRFLFVYAFKMQARIIWITLEPFIGRIGLCLYISRKICEKFPELFCASTLHPFQFPFLSLCFFTECFATQINRAFLSLNIQEPAYIIHSSILL